MHVVAHLDLSKLARTLQAEARHPELVRAITKAAAAGSTRDDLRDALHSLRLIERIPNRSVDAPGASTTSGEDTTVTGALFTQAVILYARATATKSDRPKLLGEAKLTPAERATHDEAIDLRNSAIAHFGHGDRVADVPWFGKRSSSACSNRTDGPRSRSVSIRRAPSTRSPSPRGWFRLSRPGWRSSPRGVRRCSTRPTKRSRRPPAPIRR